MKYSKEQIEILEKIINNDDTYVCDGNQKYSEGVFEFCKNICILSDICHAKILRKNTAIEILNKINNPQLELFT